MNNKKCMILCCTCIKLKVALVLCRFPLSFHESMFSICTSNLCWPTMNNESWLSWAPDHKSYLEALPDMKLQEMTFLDRRWLSSAETPHSAWAFLLLLTPDPASESAALRGYRGICLFGESETQGSLKSVAKRIHLTNHPFANSIFLFHWRVKRKARIIFNEPDSFFQTKIRQWSIWKKNVANTLNESWQMYS